MCMTSVFLATPSMVTVGVVRLLTSVFEYMKLLTNQLFAGKLFFPKDMRSIEYAKCGGFKSFAIRKHAKPYTISVQTCHLPLLKCLSYIYTIAIA